MDNPRPYRHRIEEHDAHIHSTSHHSNTSLSDAHIHSHQPDAVQLRSIEAISTLKWSLLVLGLTAAFQVVVVALSGSVALLADTVHNLTDAASTIPLWIAFILSRRSANKQYTYGYGRAEDLAGALIVVFIVFSCVFIIFESIQRLINPVFIHNIPLVMVAALIGFSGNELVARMRIGTGEKIGSAALIADGHHARTDGLTSLAVLIGAAGVAVGVWWLDGVTGLLIAGVIIWVLKDVVHQMWGRLMDAIDPALYDHIQESVSAVDGVQQVSALRLRWIGHKLEADLTITVDEDLRTVDSHTISEEARHAIFHAEDKIARVVVHVDPCGHSSGKSHHLSDNHPE